MTGNCGDGVRQFGKTDAAGKLELRVPHVTCDFQVGNGVAKGVAVAGDVNLPVVATSVDGSAGGTVPATLSLTLGAPATFGAFVPGVAQRLHGRHRRRT